MIYDIWISLINYLIQISSLLYNTIQYRMHFRPLSLFSSLSLLFTLALAPTLTTLLALVRAEVVSVHFPTPTCLALGGGTVFTITGRLWDPGATKTFWLDGGIGTLSCTVTDLGSGDWCSVCPTPSHAATSALRVNVSIGGSLWSQGNLLTYGSPELASVSPSGQLALGGGPPLTLNGKCFGTDKNFYDYLQIEGTTAIVPSSSNWLSITDTAVVVTAPASGGYVEIPNLDITIAWGAGSYVFLNNVLSFTFPALTSVSPAALALGGGTTLTLTGNRFGTNKNFYNYLSVEGTTAITPSSANWLSITDTAIVVTAPASGGYVEVSNLDISLAWGSSGAYASLNNLLSFTFPTLASVSPSALALGGGTTLTVTGVRLGTNKNFYNYLSIEGTTAIVPSSVNWLSITDTAITVSAPASGGTSEISNLDISLAWGSSGAYTWLNNVLAYTFPSITSLSRYNLPLSGAYLTVNGVRFGTDKNFFSYLSIEGKTAIVPSSGNWISTSDNAIVIFTPTCPAGATYNLDLSLAWPPYSYTAVYDSLSYVNPVLTTFEYWYENVWHLGGSYFGQYGNTFYTRVEISGSGKYISTTNIHVETDSDMAVTIPYDHDSGSGLTLYLYKDSTYYSYLTGVFI